MKCTAADLELARSDLMDMEGALCESLGAFFSFSGHALYFPTQEAPEQPELLGRERRLLVPLRWRGKLLAVLMVHNVRVREVRPLLGHLPALVHLCLENLARVRAARTDALTGLATEDVLYARMQDEAADVRAHLDNAALSDARPAPLHRLCMGLVLIRLDNGPAMARDMGYIFADKFLHLLAQTCLRALPSDVLAARVGRYELALLLTASGRMACQKLARAVLERMENISLCAPVIRTTVRPCLSAGHALYPQDMQEPELLSPMYEQARLLMARASVAARVAAGGRHTAAEGGKSRIMAFARILQDGGVVLENLPLGRVRISLGRQVKAREGLRFAVWGHEAGRQAHYKGEIVLLQVREEDALAEIIHLADTASIPEKGDSLALLDQLPVLSPPDAESALDYLASLPAHEPAAGDAEETEAAHRAGPERGTDKGRHTAGPSRRALSQDLPPAAATPAKGATGVDGTDLPAGKTATKASPAAEAQGLHGHGDFLHCFAVERDKYAQFCLVIVRLGDGPLPCPPQNEQRMTQALALWRKALAPVLSAGKAAQAHDRAGLCGRYGSNSLIFFHPRAKAEELLPCYADYCTQLQKHGMQAAAGLAGYPFLQFRKAEMQDCALKALEYALLLPKPHAGICNSLALNISADRKYSLGDIFGAVDEYKLALLADKGNAMAWNSLGVCMAALGRQHEARRHFLEALKHQRDAAQEAQICYNLGTVCQSLDELRAAARYYRRCIKNHKEHLFAHIRLGQLCEQAGRKGDARRFYEQAAAIEDASPQAPSVARRHLARVAARQKHGGEARELLHEALVKNPDDAAAMLLLAKIYLDSNEDPAMAELLARKSAGLHDKPEAWQVLSRALLALGREEEARVAQAHAVLS